MADRDEIRDEMTSGEAGGTLTRFAERWPGALVERDGRDGRRRELGEGCALRGAVEDEEPSGCSIASVDGELLRNCKVTGLETAPRCGIRAEKYARRALRGLHDLSYAVAVHIQACKKRVSAIRSSAEDNHSAPFPLWEIPCRREVSRGTGNAGPESGEKYCRDKKGYHRKDRRSNRRNKARKSADDQVHSEERNNDRRRHE